MADALLEKLRSFNTASGKCYCNDIVDLFDGHYDNYVSIPQAVSAIAILYRDIMVPTAKKRFNTASGKCYCN